MKAWHMLARIVILFAVVFMAGCSTASPVVQPTSVVLPTTDLGPVQTQVAQTVIAQITADALANPTATSTVLPPTPTDEPTPTPAATLTVAPSVTATVRVIGGGGGPIVYPTKTSTYPDRAQILSTVPVDGSDFPPGYDFDVTWKIKNTGSRDWTNEFYFKYLDGNWAPKTEEIRYTGAMDVGDTTEFTVDYVAPQTPGRYTSNWGIINDDGTVFARFYIVIDVY